MRKVIINSNSNYKQLNIFDLMQQQTTQGKLGVDTQNAALQQEARQVSTAVPVFQAVKKDNSADSGKRSTATSIDDALQYLLNAAKSLKQTEIVEVCTGEDTNEIVNNHVEADIDVGAEDKAKADSDAVSETDHKPVAAIETEHNLVKSKDEDEAAANDVGTDEAMVQGADDNSCNGCANVCDMDNTKNNEADKEDMADETETEPSTGAASESAYTATAAVTASAIDNETNVTDMESSINVTDTADKADNKANGEVTSVNDTAVKSDGDKEEAGKTDNCVSSTAESDNKDVKVMNVTEDVSKQDKAEAKKSDKAKNKGKDKAQKVKQSPKRKLQTEKKKPVPPEITAITDPHPAKSVQEIIQTIINLNTGKNSGNGTAISNAPTLHVDNKSVRVCGNEGFCIKNSNGYDLYYRCRQSCVNPASNSLLLNDDKAMLLYLDKDGDLWESEMKAEMEQTDMHNSNSSIRGLSIQFSKWRCISKLHSNFIFLQTNEELEKRMLDTRPYAYKYVKEKYLRDGYSKTVFSDNRDYWRNIRNHPLQVMIMAPQLEQLDKIGFSIAGKILEGNYFSNSDAECFNRLCQPGKNLKEIFKTVKAVYTTLVKETNLEVWDIYRKMEKLGEIDRDAVEEAYRSNYTRNDLRHIAEILARKYDGKNVFTWQSLQAYIHRLDFFEAIPVTQALPMLNDYMHMCSILHIKPRIDSDSLRREHDVTARTVRQKRDELVAKSMIENCEKNAELNYSEKIFMIRSIKDYDDLIDEAKQMHNCVASYANSISSGRSRIYVMRETARPENSLITVELDGKKNLIKQKFLAFNQPIRNKAQSEFLERWLKHVRAISAKKKSASK